MIDLLRIADLCVDYGAVRAVDGVSLMVEEGDFVALIGSNGAGKTSLLRAVVGLAPISGGTIDLEGRSLVGLPTERIVARGLALVPEGRRLYPYMSVADNLLMGAYRRTVRAEVRRDLDAVYARFPRLAERRRQMAGSLSGGEQQMAAIGRALMARPRILLLDEPSLGLAPQVVRDIARTLVDLNRTERVTIVLVEQNSRMALKLSRRAHVLETGRIVVSGMSAELAKDDHVRRIYLGEAA